jgi:alkylhydroperoxidase/carboxymuconolactone decarboxylase family protein YurZ
VSDSNLRAKYGDKAYEAGLRMQPKTFERRLARRDSLDQHFTKLWLDFAMTGMSQRPALDTRTRFLVLVGQFTMGKSHVALDDTIRGALAAGVKAREILETILQCQIYGGHTTADPAIDVFHRIAEELGLLEELGKDQLPMDGDDSTRSYEEERKKWHPDDVADPRFPALMKRHGWLALGRGLTLRPIHHLNTMHNYGLMDPEWADLWVKFCYQGMYGRFIVDDKTRLLCMVGDCLAVGEATQARGHMRGAMRQGATPREVMEVILQTCVNFGMPPMLHALESFVEVMAEDGRLAEIGNPPVHVGTYAK